MRPCREKATDVHAFEDSRSRAARTGRRTGVTTGIATGIAAGVLSVAMPLAATAIGTDGELAVAQWSSGGSGSCRESIVDGDATFPLTEIPNADVQTSASLGGIEGTIQTVEPRDLNNDAGSMEKDKTVSGALSVMNAEAKAKLVVASAAMLVGVGAVYREYRRRTRG